MKLETQLPRQVWIAIPHKAKAPVLTGMGVRLVRFSAAALTYGVQETSFEDVPARITSPARTIVDCFRFQRLVGREAAVEALREALDGRKVTNAELMRTLEVLPSRRLSAIMETGGAMTTNIAASIRARLLNRARTEGTEFQLFLDRYACERFLYRLGESEARDRCVLKGASLLALWMDEPYRATRDVDLLAFEADDEEKIRSVMTTVCNVLLP